MGQRVLSNEQLVAAGRHRARKKCRIWLIMKLSKAATDMDTHVLELDLHGFQRKSIDF